MTSDSIPSFASQVPPLRLRDPLGEFLGAMPPGQPLTYTFADAVKLCGHSCPTVARAWVMTAAALDALYPGGELPVRGEISVVVGGERDDGGTGPTSMVVGLLTGAAPETGFGGLAGRFRRKDLLSFDPRLEGKMRFSRLDSGAEVEVTFDRAGMPPAAPQMSQLMGRALHGEASPEELREFGALWQGRVQALLQQPERCVRVQRAGAKG